jgi:hypothetical protein
MKPCFELADIIRRFVPSFVEQYHPPAFQQKTLEAITLCRTAALGGHKQRCTHCGHEHISYNSCRNRHCPKCQNKERELWIRQIKDILPKGRYFHVIFTLPASLNDLFMAHPKEMQDTLFQAAWQTLNQFACLPVYLGAKTGMIAVLHTWGQTLTLHPHLHCIVPCGGVDDKGQWVRGKKTDNRTPFLFPVTQMSGMFRGKFLSLASKKLKKKNDCKLPTIKEKYFNINIQPPFNQIDHLIKYLGRYTHKAAISNHRILSIDDQGVVFSYKDYREKAANQLKEMRLSGEEFLRRFCLHIQQKGFRKVRYFGLFSSANRNLLNSVRLAFGQPPVQARKKEKWKEVVREVWKYDPCLCPECKEGVMVIVEQILPWRRPPPSKNETILS